MFAFKILSLQYITILTKIFKFCRRHFVVCFLGTLRANPYRIHAHCMGDDVNVCTEFEKARCRG